MPALTASLRKEYADDFNACQIRPERQAEVDSMVDKLLATRRRYEAVAARTGVPWFVIAVIHARECSSNFTCHLHNGDPLTARTVHVPPGRPKTGTPPFNWEDSAEDALRGQKLDKWTDWTIPGVLYKLEAYNGFGYRNRVPPVKSPYLWSYSNLYTSGLFVADGTFSPTARSKQPGTAALVRRMAERGLIRFDEHGPDPSVRYSDTEVSDAALQLQKALNKIPGIFLREDGIPGRRTSDASMRVFGRHLPGDPRDTASPTTSAARTG